MQRRSRISQSLVAELGGRFAHHGRLLLGIFLGVKFVDVHSLGLS